MSGLLYFVCEGDHTDYVAVSAEDHERMLPLMRMALYCTHIGGVAVGRGEFDGEAATLVTEDDIARRAITEDGALAEFLYAAREQVLTMPVVGREGA